MAAKNAARAMPAEALREKVASILAACRQPAILEPGEAPLALSADQSKWSVDSRGLLVEAWDETRSYARRVVAVKEERRGRWTLEVARFGGKTGLATIVDLDRPQALEVMRRSGRETLKESLRAWLARQFPGWRIAELTAGADLEHTLSPAYPRAFIDKGGRRWAALAAPAGAAESDAALTFGLIWLSRLRPRGAEGLALFLPEAALRNTALRLRHLRLNCRLFAYDAAGFEAEVDPADCGNVLSELTALTEAPARDPWEPEVKDWQPEEWLEAAVRSDIRVLDASLEAEPVYGQVPALAGHDRGIIDLLAVDAAGRLCVIEMKSSEDPHLPIQALDYWIRVAHHAAAGDFGRAGYFPGKALLPAAPRLLLAAPALDFHPTTESVLGFFAPGLEVERIGLRVEWQRALRVVMRAKGAESPEWKGTGVRRCLWDGSIKSGKL